MHALKARVTDHVVENLTSDEVREIVACGFSGETPNIEKQDKMRLVKTGPIYSWWSRPLLAYAERHFPNEEWENRCIQCGWEIDETELLLRKFPKWDDYDREYVYQSRLKCGNPECGRCDGLDHYDVDWDEWEPELDHESDNIHNPFCKLPVKYYSLSRSKSREQ